jgi:hypothetical protein
MIQSLKDYYINLPKCPICLDRVGKRGKITICGHKFHKRCIRQWREINHTCPICRRDLRTEEEMEMDRIIDYLELNMSEGTITILDENSDFIKIFISVMLGGYLLGFTYIVYVSLPDNH